MSRVINEHWLISVPNENDGDEAWKRLCDALDKLKTCSEYRFHIPDLNTKTLDDVVAAIDELGHLEVESTVLVSKLITSMINLVEHRRENIERHLRVDNVTMREYLIRFRWDANKYPTRQSINRIIPLISKELSDTAQDLNNKITAYTSLETSHDTLDKKRMGNFATKYLGEYVNRSHFVTDSEYLKTLAVAVPKRLRDHWNSKYESLHDEVVPQSSVYVDEDDDYCLFTVTVFKTAESEFIAAAKREKFVVRNDFEYNDAEIYEFIKEVNRLQHDKHKMYKPLLRWLRTNLSETYITMVHVKAAKIYVESVVRYGLPVDFQTVLLIVERAKVKRLKKTLKALYEHLEISPKTNGPRTTDQDLLDAEYYPYVYTKIKASIEEILS